jgi:hypothetical protein
LEAAFVLLEFSSPSRRIFIGSHSLPPLWFVVSVLQLVANMEKMVNEDLSSTAKHVDSFEAVEQTKEVPLDPAAPEGKALRVSSTLDPK